MTIIANVSGNNAAKWFSGGLPMSAIRAKIFSYCTTNINPPGELQINQWLKENPDIEIVELYLLKPIAAHNGAANIFCLISISRINLRTASSLALASTSNVISRLSHDSGKSSGLI